jgi:hypothetical protein
MSRSSFPRQAVTLALTILLFRVQAIPAQTSFEMTPEIDRLLRSALDDMYRYDLESAERKFDELVRRFPDHPVGPMHKAEVVWWRALRSKNKSLQTTFEGYTDEAIAKGQELVKRNAGDFYAQLYMAAAYGNRTRYNIYITRNNYRAMRAGLKGYSYVKLAYGLRPNYVDCLIGIGAYNYVAGSLPVALKLIAWMFIEGGDKDKGIEQLQTVAQKGEYGQTEAKMVLLGAYYNEKLFEKYRQLVTELIEQYPSNPVFISWLADSYVRERKLDEGIRFLTALLNRPKSIARGSLATAQTIYEKGRLELEKGVLDDCMSSFNQVLDMKLQDPPLLSRVHLLRAFAFDLKGQRETAVAEYQTVLGLMDIEGSHKKAKGFLKTPYPGVARN